MKKALIILSIGFILLPTLGKAITILKKDKPLVVMMEISKSNGGYWAAVNLYANVDYHVDSYDATNNVIYARLNCEGNGYTACRVPHQTSQSGLPSAVIDKLGKMPIESTINRLIESSEEAVAVGTLAGSQCRKAASNQAKGAQLFDYTSTWNFDRKGNGTMKIVFREIEQETSDALLQTKKRR